MPCVAKRGSDEFAIKRAHDEADRDGAQQRPRELLLPALRPQRGPVHLRQLTCCTVASLPSKVFVVRAAHTNRVWLGRRRAPRQVLGLQ